MERTVEIIGGLSLRDIAEGGAVFELKYDPPNKNDAKEEEEYSLELQKYLKPECLDVHKAYDGSEPFASIGDQMDNLLEGGKIKKKIIREGYGLKPEDHCNVNIHYNAYVQYEALPFDSTYVRKKPFTFTIGEGQVIEGLEIAVLSMKLNEKSQFLIHPELAYRSGGLGRIPPNAVVLFEIELCDTLQPSKHNTAEKNEKDFSIVYQSCLALHLQGKSMFKLKDYHNAIKVYNTAIHKLEEAVLNDYDEQLKSETLLVGLYTNLLICYTVVENPKRGCICAQTIYEMARNETFVVSVKVYFNHAKCVRMLGDYGRALKILSKARRMEPNNKEIEKEFCLLKEVQKKEKEEA